MALAVEKSAAFLAAAQGDDQLVSFQSGDFDRTWPFPQTSQGGIAAVQGGERPRKENLTRKNRCWLRLQRRFCGTVIGHCLTLRADCTDLLRYLPQSDRYKHPFAKFLNLETPFQRCHRDQKRPFFRIQGQGLADSSHAFAVLAAIIYPSLRGQPTWSLHLTDCAARKTAQGES
ncbi:conserved hypothetical protein [Coccidioides posadasii str. Silveira]|uniref:Uncharacterized protein n=1 Tax=Coccidioides posadasii (strain RMSCC 757 / Silveira) TaxID=443226 RepID=E9DGT3_COCPS|nr:conserved hypothetical protein [Coccidioides posadasii str. Silveira]